jgi:hypothetical protein
VYQHKRRDQNDPERHTVGASFHGFPQLSASRVGPDSFLNRAKGSTIKISLSTEIISI